MQIYTLVFTDPGCPTYELRVVWWFEDAKMARRYAMEMIPNQALIGRRLQDLKPLHASHKTTKFLRVEEGWDPKCVPAACAPNGMEFRDFISKPKNKPAFIFVDDEAE